MSADTQFKDFVERQKRNAAAESAGAEAPIDWEEQKREWLSRLDELYESISLYLKEYMNDGFVTMKHSPVKLDEEYIGKYEANDLEIAIGPQIITLTPVGTLLVGSKGRVDVEGNAGTSRLVLVGKNVADPQSMFRITVTVHPPIGLSGTLPQAPVQTVEAPPLDKIEWTWKIVSRPPAMRFIELNKDSFLEMLMEVSNA